MQVRARYPCELVRTCAILGALAAVVFAACAGTAGADREQGRKIEIQMKDFAFAPTVLTLEAGQKITLLLRNPDTVEHEFMAGREPMRDGGYKQDLLAFFEIAPTPTADHAMGHGTEAVSVRVQPGGTATISFVVPGAFGRYEFGCFLPGHYEAGMKGALTIEVPGVPIDSVGPATSGIPRPVATAPPKLAPPAVPMPTGDSEMEAH